MASSKPATLFFALMLALAPAASRAQTSSAVAPAPSAVWTAEVASTGPVDSLTGRSGKLLARVVSTTHPGGIRVLRELFGDSATARPGVYTASLASRPFSLITLLPFRAKSAGRVGQYRMGNWPGERSGSGAVPEGFIEVTNENRDLRVSQHFRLRDFLTHDQEGVWPKYLVLREALLDKLELVISDLQQRGVRVEHVSVLSGFRTPQYNARGVRPGGRARDSRHQYGDAADIFVDNDGNGIMDDLNRDGRVDIRDTRMVLESVERVERLNPDLVGGAGLYGSTRSHGPFVHLDVRGTRARWGA